MEELERRVARIRTSISKGRNDLVSGNRTRIIETATRLFRAEGYQRTAIGDIAAALGVSQGNIYQYVEKKDDILILILYSAVEDYKSDLFVIEDEDLDPVEMLIRAIRTYYAILDRHHEKTTVIYHQIFHLERDDRALFGQVEAAVTALFERRVAAVIAAGGCAPTDAFLLASKIVSLGHTWALKRRRLKAHTDIDGYSQTQIDYVFRILGRAPGTG